jgi:hypothetical protein
MSKDLGENDVPGITYEKSKNRGDINCETHVKIRILSPVELSVNLSDGT